MTDTAGGEIVQKPWSIAIFDRVDVKDKFKAVLWKKSPQFIASVLTVVSQNDLLKKADPTSIYLAALVAATLDLPINPNLWYAHIVPYGGKAQFQMWYRWFIQLAHRTNLFRDIDAQPVYEWQRVQDDTVFGWWTFKRSAKTSDKIIWYASYFELISWFKHTFYMSLEEIQEHGKEYSKTYWLESGRWKKDFDAMAEKTVLKLLLNKYAPLSLENTYQLAEAIKYDQAIINADWTPDYADNEPSMEAVMEWFEKSPLPSNKGGDAEEWLS